MLPCFLSTTVGWTGGPALEVGVLQKVPATFVKIKKADSEMGMDPYVVMGSQNKYAQRVYLIDGDVFYFWICNF